MLTDSSELWRLGAAMPGVVGSREGAWQGHSAASTAAHAKRMLEPVQVVQSVGASSRTPKGCGFDPWPGYVREAASRCFSPPSSSFSKIIKTCSQVRIYKQMLNPPFTFLCESDRALGVSFG